MSIFSRAIINEILKKFLWENKSNINVAILTMLQYTAQGYQHVPIAGQPLPLYLQNFLTFPN